VPGISLAVVPSATPGDSRAALAALCTELEKLLDRRITCLHPATYGELTAALERDRVQYAWMSPAQMVMAGEHIQLRPLLSAVRNEKTDYCSALFVDDASPARFTEQLRGKRIAWVDRTSASGYLFVRLQLAARGIEPDSFFSEELFESSHTGVVKAVLEGRADAGATYAERPAAGQPITRAGFVAVAPEHKVRVLEWTATIPNDVIAGHGLLSKDEHRLFGNAILTLGEREDGRKLLYNAFHAERFVTTPRNTLKPLYDLVRLARAHGLLAHL
jgi:phosphonate transport system substrate-binding protein